jgi:hypothetical protein
MNEEGEGGKGESDKEVVEGGEVKGKEGEAGSRGGVERETDKKKDKVEEGKREEDDTGEKTNTRPSSFRDEGGVFLVYTPTCLHGTVTLDGHPDEPMALVEFQGVCKCSPLKDDCKDCHFRGAELRQKDVMFMPMAFAELAEEFGESRNREWISLVLEEVERKEPGPARYRRIGFMAEQIGLEDNMLVLENSGRKIDAGDMSAKIDEEDQEELGVMEGWDDTLYRGAVILV